MLVGFGLLVLLLSDIFIFVAAGLFFVAGVAVMFYAVKLFLAARKMNITPEDTASAYRENVSIHGEHYQQ